MQVLQYYTIRIFSTLSHSRECLITLLCYLYTDSDSSLYSVVILVTVWSDCMSVVSVVR